MSNEKKMNRYLEENYVYGKALENAEVYTALDSENTEKLKNIDPTNVDFKGINYIEKEDGTVFEIGRFEITLPNGENVVLTVDKNGNDMSCEFEFETEDGKMHKEFKLTPKMQEQIMSKAIDGKVQGIVDTQTIQDSLFPNSQEEMEEEITKNTLIPKSAKEVVEKIKEKNPQADVKEVVEEEQEKEFKHEDKKEEINDVKQEEESYELELPENIKDVVKEKQEEYGSKVKHVLIAKNPSSITDQLMDDAGIEKNGGPVYCLQLSNNSAATVSDRVVLVQGEKVIDDTRYYEDGTNFMNNYKDSNVVENVEDMASKLYYTDIHGHTIVADMKAEPRDLRPDEKDILAEKLNELENDEKGIRSSDMPVEQKIAALQSINIKRLHTLNEVGLEVPEIRSEIIADLEIHEDIKDDIEDRQEVETPEEEEEKNEEDDIDPRESHNRYNGRQYE